LTVNVTAVGLAFVSSIASPTEDSALTAVQLLWVNLIMDTFAALALATDPPTLELLNRKPEPKDASIISFNMWKMIFGEAILQLVITFILNFAGTSIFTGWTDKAVKTVTFNTFVWLQIFNEVNCRRLDNKLNVFAGIHRNPFFIAITLIMIGGQVIIISVGRTVFSVVPLNGSQWAASIILGILSLPVGAIIRLTPNAFIKTFIPHRLLEKKRKTVVYDEEAITEWNPVIDIVRDDLIFIKSLRNKRRLGSLGDPRKAIRRLIPSHKDKEKGDSSSIRRPTTPGEANSGPPSPSPSPSDRKQRSRSNSAFKPAAMVPALVATSMMWSPSSPATEARIADSFPVTMSREDLKKEGMEVHKDTDPNDPIVGENAASYNPLESNRPRSPHEHSDQGESSKSHWRERLSVHSRATSKSSVTSSPIGTQSPSGGLFAPTRQDVSLERRPSIKGPNEDRPSTPTDDKGG
jgi:Ca2+-transporting ATPase